MKKIRIKSPVPVYIAAAVWVLAGVLFPGALLKSWSLLLIAAISIASIFAFDKLFPGKTIEMHAQVDTGDAEVNEQIKKGRETLDNLVKHNDALPDVEITNRLNRITNAGYAIFDCIEKDISKAPQVRKFMNYYLPTTEKLVANYRALADAPTRGENMTNAMRSVENSLDMIAGAFEKQLDSLYQDKAFDMETDVRVLETMLSGDGLTDSSNALNIEQMFKTSQTGI